VLGNIPEREHIVLADKISGTDRSKTERIKRESETVKIHKVKRLKEENLERRILIVAAVK
jgi:hypothetical protein